MRKAPLSEGGLSRASPSGVTASHEESRVVKGIPPCVRQRIGGFLLLRTVLLTVGLPVPLRPSDRHAMQRLSAAPKLACLLATRLARVATLHAGAYGILLGGETAGHAWRARIARGMEWGLNRSGGMTVRGRLGISDASTTQAARSGGWRRSTDGVTAACTAS